MKRRALALSFSLALAVCLEAGSLAAAATDATGTPAANGQSTAPGSPTPSAGGDRGPIIAADKERLDRLFERLRLARSEEESKPIEDAIWNAWLDLAPTIEIRRQMDEAMAARGNYDFDKALAILNDVVAKAPSYAEGWNQRAFIYFLKEEYDKSEADIEKALALEPRHFGALSGEAHILMRTGRIDAGQRFLMRAVDIYPFIGERFMLLPENRKPIPAESEQEL